MIPDEKSLNSKHMQVEKIEIDQLFGVKKFKTVDLFSDDFNIGAKKQTKKVETTENLFKAFDNAEITCSNQKWYLQNEFASFGPYSSEEIFVFLNHLLEKNPEIKEDLNFLVIDSLNDMHYRPDSVVDLLADEVKDTVKNIDPNKELERIIFTRKDSGAGDKQSPMNKLRPRKLSDNPQLITKYDVYEMSSKFKHAQHLPLIQLKDQLRALKNKENLKNYVNQRNNRQLNYNLNARPFQINNPLNKFNNFNQNKFDYSLGGNNNYKQQNFNHKFNNNKFNNRKQSNEFNNGDKPQFQTVGPHQETNNYFNYYNKDNQGLENTVSSIIQY